MKDIVYTIEQVNYCGKGINTNLLFKTKEILRKLHLDWFSVYLAIICYSCNRRFNHYNIFIVFSCTSIQ